MIIISGIFLFRIVCKTSKSFQKKKKEKKKALQMIFLCHTLFKAFHQKPIEFGTNGTRIAKS